MQDTIERLNLQLGFEGWAGDEGFDLTTSEIESLYIDPHTFNAWRGYLAAHGPHGMRPAGQQLYAEIKKSSKYAHQAEMCRTHPCGYPFKIQIGSDPGGYEVVGGVGGQYRISDVNLYVLQDGEKIRLN